MRVIRKKRKDIICLVEIGLLGIIQEGFKLFKVSFELSFVQAKLH